MATQTGLLLCAVGAAVIPHMAAQAGLPPLLLCALWGLQRALEPGGFEILF